MTLRSLATTNCPGFLRPTLQRIENSPISLRLARGTFWSMAGAVISRGLMLVASIFVARMLGKTVYGELGMIRSTVGMFGVFAGFGLGLTATKHVAEFRESDPERAGRIIGISSLFALFTGGLMAIGLFVFAPWLSEHTINAPHLSGVLRIGVLILFFEALNGAQTGALAGFEAFKAIAYVNLTVGLISFPILIGGAYFGGLVGAVWGLAINLCVNWLLNHLALRREAQRHGVPLGLRDCKREWPILWKYSLPAALARIMAGPTNWVCAALLVNQPNGYGEMAIVNATNQWFVVLLFIPSMLGRVLLPILSGQFGGNKTKQSMKTMLFAIKLNLLIVIPLAIGTCFISPQIMNLYGEDFVEGWPTLIVVLCTTCLLAIHEPALQAIMASGRMWASYVMNTGWAIMFILGTVLLIDYGALGLASAKGIGYFVHVAWTFGFAACLLRNVNVHNEESRC